jgi:hypothetical protein
MNPLPLIVIYGHSADCKAVYPLRDALLPDAKALNRRAKVNSDRAAVIPGAYFAPECWSGSQLGTLG